MELPQSQEFQEGVHFEHGIGRLRLGISTVLPKLACQKEFEPYELWTVVVLVQEWDRREPLRLFGFARRGTAATEFNPSEALQEVPQKAARGGSSCAIRRP